jgi:hypothetical protein
MSVLLNACMVRAVQALLERAVHRWEYERATEQKKKAQVATYMSMLK